MELLRLKLPWPPSINHYWEQRGIIRYLSEKAKAFRLETQLAFIRNKHPGFADLKPLFVEIMLYPPDKRRRDIDNVLKPLLDAMQHAGVYDDDYQIAHLTVIRSDEKLNACEVSIRCL